MSEDSKDYEVVTYENLPEHVKDVALPPEDWEHRDPENVYAHECLSCEFTGYGVETENGQFEVMQDGGETNIYNIGEGNLAAGAIQLRPGNGEWVCENCLDGITDASNRLYGVLPTGEQTMVRYWNTLLLNPWEDVEVAYDETPLERAVKAFIQHAQTISVDAHRYYDPETDREFGHRAGELVDALVDAPWASRNFRSTFINLVLDDEIRLPAPALIVECNNKILVHEAYADAVRDRFLSEWDEYKDTRGQTTATHTNC